MPQRLVMTVLLEDPAKVAAPTLFCNHVALSRAGTEVQFDFVTLDLNTIAAKLRECEKHPEHEIQIQGKTAAKIVVPMHVFVQLEDTFREIFEQVRKELAVDEVSNERNTVV